MVWYCPQLGGDDATMILEIPILFLSLALLCCTSSNPQNLLVCPLPAAKTEPMSFSQPQQHIAGRSQKGAPLFDDYFSPPSEGSG